jgi:hypothetical protein
MKSIKQIAQIRNLGLNKKTHGMSKTRFYKIWKGIINRCNNKNNYGYQNYGGRGIRVNNNWLVFENFYRDMFEGYDDNLSIDRIDNNGDYKKENCHWVSQKIQNLNYSRNRIIEFRNKKQTLKEWADEKGIKWDCLFMRLKKGWSIEKSLLTGQKAIKVN